MAGGNRVRYRTQVINKTSVLPNTSDFFARRIIWEIVSVMHLPIRKKNLRVSHSTSFQCITLWELVDFREGQDCSKMQYYTSTHPHCPLSTPVWCMATTLTKEETRKDNQSLPSHFERGWTESFHRKWNKVSLTKWSYYYQGNDKFCCFDKFCLPWFITYYNVTNSTRGLIKWMKYTWRYEGIKVQK